MDKILSKDTIKNVFSALGAKTSDSNYGVALLDKTSGEPKGFMGMSDLASVLGVMATYPSTALNISSDIKAIEKGIYFIAKTSWGGVPQDIPVSEDGLLAVFKWGDTAIGYLFITSSGSCYSGIKWWSDSIAWRKLD